MVDTEIEDAIRDLKAWITTQDRTEAYLAKKIGVTRQQVNLWLRGGSLPSLPAWLKIQRFLRSNPVKRAKTGK